MLSLELGKSMLAVSDSVYNISFLSDLHFDYCKGSEIRFFDFLSKDSSEGILILAGDFYNSFKKTIKFIKKLESMKIQGFFVLGNHDYWNKGAFTYNEVIDMVSKSTIQNKYFKFLKTGVTYRIGDYFFIGDTGWTSFNNGMETLIFDKRTIKLPEFEEVKNFSFKEISFFHRQWLEFANNILSSHQKVIVVTHFPMFNNTLYLKYSKKSDLWWRSLVDIANTKNNFWNIYGHTHETNKIKNFVSNQIGYDCDPYYQFKTLQRLSNETNLEIKKNSLISGFYNSNTISAKDKYEIKEIIERGYRRTAANKRVISEVVNNFESYISSIEKIMDNETIEEFIGYASSFEIPFPTRVAIKEAIKILKDEMQDIRTYMTAIVVTGYVWNNMIYGLDSMRPLDDFDIIRLYLYFKTIKKYNIPIDLIKRIKRHRINRLVVNNVDVFIPVINDKYQLDKEDLIHLKEIDINSITIYNSTSLTIDVVHDDKPIFDSESNYTKENIDFEKYKKFGFESVDKIKANAWTIVDDHTVGVILDKKKYREWGIWEVRVPIRKYNVISKYWEGVNLISGDSIKIKTRHIMRDAKIQLKQKYIYISWNNLFKKMINKKFHNSFINYSLVDKFDFEIIMIFKSDINLENKCVEIQLHEIPLKL